MESIYKYYLGITDEQTLLLPRGFKYLTVQIQDDKPVLWVMIDLGAKDIQNVKIVIRGTGQVWTEEDMQYIGTFQISNFVGHCFGQRSESWDET